MARFLLWPLWILQLFGGAKSFESNPLLGNATLNRWGLHTGRIRLAHWATRLRWWLLAPLVARDLRRRFQAEGYLVLENFLPTEAFERLRAGALMWQTEVREMIQGDTLTLRVLFDDRALAKLPECRALLEHRPFINLLRYCAATLRWPQFYLQCIKHGSGHDPQKDLHADTFHPTMKAWLFPERRRRAQRTVQLRGGLAATDRGAFGLGARAKLACRPRQPLFRQGLAQDRGRRTCGRGPAAPDRMQRQGQHARHRQHAWLPPAR